VDLDIAVLPGAGSFGGELRALLRAWRPAAWLVRYPGRFGADFGAPAASFDEVVRSCVEQLRRRPAAGPHRRPVLFGHSFGAYVGYAAAAEWERLGHELTALVVVGAMPPHRFSPPEAPIRGRAHLAAYLDEINPEIVAAGEWRDVTIDAALADLTLLRQFRPARYGALRCPILAARGESDPLTTAAGLAEWGRATRGACEHRTFTGGHTDPLHDEALSRWLREALPAAPTLVGEHPAGGA
jgi:surfactin synthase thioesterase subunit